jgi:hypothetical protein
VQQHLWPVEHREQLIFVAVQPLQQSVKGSKAGAAAEDALKPCPQCPSLAPVRRAAVSLEVGIEPPV